MNDRPIETYKGYDLSSIHRQYGNYILDCIRLNGVSSIDDALDIRQNVYLGLFKRSIKAKLPECQSLTGYIKRATHNAVVDFRNTQRRENILFDWINDDHDHIGRKMDEITFQHWMNENRELELRILKAIEFLNEYSPSIGVSMRAIINYVYDGMTAEQIAERLQTKTGTVFSWISRFREDLRNHMKSS